MGGAVFIFSTALASLLCVQLSNIFATLGIIVLVLFGLIGAKDDYMKISHKTNAGMSARSKMFFLFGASLGLCLIL